MDCPNKTKIGLSPQYINRLQKTMLDGKIKHGKEFQIPIGYNTKLNNNIRKPIEAEMQD